MLLLLLSLGIERMVDFGRKRLLKKELGDTNAFFLSFSFELGFLEQYVRCPATPEIINETNKRANKQIEEKMERR